MNKDLIYKILIDKLLADDSDREFLLPAIKSFNEVGSVALTDMKFLKLLLKEEDFELQKLADHFKEKLHQAALIYYKAKKRLSDPSMETIHSLDGLPLQCRQGFLIDENTFSNTSALIKIAVDRHFLNTKERSFTALKTALQNKFTKITEDLKNYHFSFLLTGNMVSALDICKSSVPSSELELFESTEKSIKNLLDVQLSKAREFAGNDNWNSTEVNPDILFDELLKLYRASDSDNDKQLLFEKLCCVAELSRFDKIQDLVKTPWQKINASLIFTLRFGDSENKTWAEWMDWSRSLRAGFSSQLDMLISESLEKEPAVFFLLLNSKNNFLSKDQAGLLQTIANKSSAKIANENFIMRWGYILSKDELQFLRHGKEKTTTTQVPGIESVKKLEVGDDRCTQVTTTPGSAPVVATVNPIALKKKEEKVAKQPVVPPEPTIWDKHLFPFISENWAVLTGILMTVLGGSTLAYLKWDQHWLWRYTIIPLMLGALTTGLSWLASWLEKRDKELKTTGVILRGAAVALLPINFMTVALLSHDSEISFASRSILVLVLSILYILWAGWGLRKWCNAISAEIGNILAITLLMINGLVMLGPIAAALGKVDTLSLNRIVGTGFYLGFFLIGAVVIYFTYKVLNKDLLNDKRLLCFFGLTLSVTYLQVFIWVHGFLKVLPQVYTYAPMIILSGLLLFIVEKRFLELNNESKMHSAESFLGFALILLGVLMGFVDPLFRIFVLSLAGVVWLYQAFSRRHPLHYWISLTFLAMAGASIGLLEFFPREMLPLLGLGLSGVMSLGILFSQRAENNDLHKAACGMQHVLFFLTAFVTVLCQWHYLTPPLFSACCLLALVVGFFWRAFRDKQLRWIHVAMILLAMTLPYLGCVDMLGQTLHGNKMVFGLAILSILWLVFTAYVKHQLIQNARSTVLVSYGALAVAAMILRVLFERNLPGDLLNKLVDYSGPLMITVCLVFATYFTRSLLPALFAFIVVIILFPELKAGFKETFEMIGWGSGFGSACSSLAVLTGCFFLRKSQFLKKLDGGDRIMGKFLFPVRRYDHSLFTWPLLAAALFLILKTETLTFARNIVNDSVHIKASMALFITGLSWMTLGIYYRRFSFMKASTYIGWLWIFIGILCAYLHVSTDPYWSRPLLLTLLLMQLVYFVHRYYLGNILEWTEEQLQKPTYHLLCGLSPLIALFICGALWLGEPPREMMFLMLFIVIQLCWHELKLKFYLFSSVLFLLILNTIFALSCPGNDFLFDRIDFYEFLLPVSIFFFISQLIYLIFENQEEGYQKLKSLILPFVSGSGVFLVLIGVASVILSIFNEQFTSWQLIIIFVSLLLLARGQQAVVVYMILLLNVYCYLNLRLTSQPINGVPDKVLLLIEPWRLGLLAFVFAISGIIGKYLRDKFEPIICGSKPLLFFKSPHIGFVYVPGVLVSVFCVFIHTVYPDFRSSSTQLIGSYLAASALFLIAWDWRKQFLFVFSTIVLILANIHLVRVFAGDWLISVGLSHLHIFCLGLVLTLLEGAVTKRIKTDKFIVIYMNRLCLSMGGLILALLAVNYAVKHNLAEISYHRFIISGLMALLAGLSFRRAARNPDEEEIQYVEIFEAVYHVGVTIAIWCMILLIPWFRSPATGLLALGIPVLFFYFKTEYNQHSKSELINRFRHTTATLCFLILILYIFRSVFQILLFPDESVSFVFYHYNSFFILVISVILLRLHGLGGNFWHAFYGGLFLMVSSFFAITFFPKLSPVAYPYNSAFCAILLAHFFTALSYERSPLRSVIQWMSGINDEFWHVLRKDWGICQLLLAHVAVGWAIINFAQNTYFLAPLVFAAFTLLLHHGIIKKSPIYLGIAALDLLLALHMDFIVPSYLPQYYVIWVILGAWTAALFSLFIIDKLRQLKVYGYLSAGFSGLVMAHIIFYHFPWSITGLWCFVLMVVLIGIIPRVQRKMDVLGEYLAVYALLLAPVWLVFFISRTCVILNGKIEFSNTGFAATAIAIALTGTLCLLFKRYLLKDYLESALYPPFIFDQFLVFLGKYGKHFFTVGLYISFTMTVLIQVAHYMTPFSQIDLILLCILYAGLTVAWYFDGQLSKTMPPYYLLQLCFLGFFAVIRRQLMLTTDFWHYEYDVWAALTVSFILVGIKQFIDLRPKEVRMPLLTSICLLPVVALIWVMVHNLGTNTAMIVVGLQSLMFTYIGKDNRESPYNVVAIAGFVGFVIMLFWTKLEFRVIHAYIIPVGTGILILLQLFRDRINPETRNQVRFVTLIAMLGTAGYYALINSEAPTAYIIIFCVLCLLSMGVGSFLRVRLYLYLGFAGLLVDLVAIFYRVFLHLESGRMTLIGCLVLLTGLLFVGGAVYYKANQDKMNRLVDHWRNKLGAWE